MISKETAVCMLREAFDSDGNLSKDRLKRIMQCAQRSQQDVSQMPQHDGNTLELHKDVTIAFNPAAGKPLELWFGRIMKMVMVTSTGRRSLRLMSYPVDNMPPGLHIMYNYYEKIPRRPRTFRYGTRPLEPILYRYSSINILCVVHFDFHPNDHTYTLSREQWRGVREDLQTLSNKQ